MEGAGGLAENIQKNYLDGKYTFSRLSVQGLSENGFSGDRHVKAVDASEESGIVAVGFNQGDVAIINSKDGACQRRLEVDQPQSCTLNDIRLLARGKKLVTAGGSKNVNVWDVESGALDVGLEGHSGEISVVKGTLRALISASSTDDCINIWDLRKKASTKTLYPSGSVVAMEYYQQPAFTLVTGLAHSVRVWDLRKTGEVLKEFSVGGCLRCLAISPNSDRVVVGSSDKNGDGIITVCSTATWDVVHAVRDLGDKKRNGKFKAVFNLHVDESKIVAGCQHAHEKPNEKIHIWRSPAEVSTPPEHLHVLAENHGGQTNGVCVKGSTIYSVGESAREDQPFSQVLKWDFS